MNRLAASFAITLALSALSASALGQSVPPRRDPIVVDVLVPSADTTDARATSAPPVVEGSRTGPAAANAPAIVVIAPITITARDLPRESVLFAADTPSLLIDADEPTSVALSPAGTRPEYVIATCVTPCSVPVPPGTYRVRGESRSGRRAAGRFVFDQPGQRMHLRRPSGPQTGIVLTALGAAGAVAGVAMAVAGSYALVDSGSIGVLLFSPLVFAIGGGLVGGGIALAVRGSRVQVERVLTRDAVVGAATQRPRWSVAPHVGSGTYGAGFVAQF